MQSPNKLQTSCSNSSSTEQTVNSSDERNVNIVSLGKMENNLAVATTITIRCREITIKFSSDNPVSTVCDIVKTLESSML